MDAYVDAASPVEEANKLLLVGPQDFPYCLFRLLLRNIGQILVNEAQLDTLDLVPDGFSDVNALKGRHSDVWLEDYFEEGEIGISDHLRSWLLLALPGLPMRKVIQHQPVFFFPEHKST